MKSFTSILALAMALVARAAPIPKSAVDIERRSNDGRVDWISTDDQDRILNCACNPGFAPVSDVSIPAGQTVTTYFEENWQGNCWTTLVDEVNTGTGMLAELAFGAWSGLTFFDVSAIVVPTDTKNIYAMTPGDSDSPVSGCMDGKVGGLPGSIACENNIYVNPPDEQTKSTNSNYIKVFVGPPASDATVQTRSVEELGQGLPRSFIEGTA